ncbi:hypothetical protein ID866_9667 [Astraeus odoratus]|nr:hypothetical protein ID866_9667 [Astraeus odoratus]
MVSASTRMWTAMFSSGSSPNPLARMRKLCRWGGLPT